MSEKVSEREGEGVGDEVSKWVKEKVSEDSE